MLLIIIRSQDNLNLVTLWRWLPMPMCLDSTVQRRSLSREKMICHWKSVSYLLTSLFGHFIFILLIYFLSEIILGATIHYTGGYQFLAAVYFSRSTITHHYLLPLELLTKQKFCAPWRCQVLGSPVVVWRQIGVIAERRLTGILSHVTQ